MAGSRRPRTHCSRTSSRCQTASTPLFPWNQSIDPGTDSTMPAPLSGLTILDLSRVLSGPYCTMLAADMGARVIKIEHPIRGDDTRAWGPPFIEGESSYYLSINRNKESVAIDFKTDAGRDLVLALAAKADVIVE